MKSIKCFLGLHDLKLRKEFDEKATLPPGMSGSSGWNHIKIYKCQRIGCNKEVKKVSNWHEMMFCKVCQRRTRHRGRIWSDAGGGDTWFGQGDGHQFWICTECGNVSRG